MSLIERPLVVLIAAAEPRDRSAIEALLTALDRQGDAVTHEWLGVPSPDALRARLEDTSSPRVDLFAWDGSSDALLSAMAPLPQETQRPPLTLLLVDTIAAEVPDLGNSGILRIRRDLAGSSCRAAIEAFLTAVLAGQPLSDAYTQAIDGLSSRGHRTRLSSGGVELALEETIAWQASGPDAPLMDPTPDTGSGVERVVRFPSPSLAPAWQSLSLDPLPGGLPAPPERGFCGRGTEITDIEEALSRANGGSVWLYGRVGMGKTTLALHAARWLVRTGAFERIVYVNWGAGGMAEHALYAVGRSLLGREWDPRDGSSLSQIDKALATGRTLIIWDQIDTVLREGALPLAADARQALWELAVHLEDAGARLVMISDTQDLSAEASATNPRLSMQVGPLNEPDAIDFWSALRPGLGEDLDQVEALVRALGSHPLGLMLAAAVFPGQPAGDTLAGLIEMMPGVANGEARLGNQALDIGIECLMRSLGEDTRAMLTRLGLYTQGFMQALALRLMQVEPEIWTATQSRFVDAGLLRELSMPGFSVPFVRLHPALERYLAQRVAGEARARWEPIYTAGYLGLLNWLATSEARSPEHVQFLAYCELGNLLKSQRLLLARQDLAHASDMLRGLTHFCALLGLNGERQRLVQEFERAVQVVVPEEGPLGRQGVQFMLQRSDELLAQRQIPQAGALLQQLTQRMAAENGLNYGGDDAQIDKAMVMHRMARAVMAMGRPDAALSSLRQALETLPSHTDDRAVTGARIEMLQEQASLLRGAGATDQALESCDQALELANQLDLPQSRAQLQSERGVLLTIKGELAEAREAYEQAMFLFQNLGAQDRIVQVWEGLSQVAWQDNDLALAQQCLDQAMEALPEEHSPAQEAHLYRLTAQIAEMEGRVVDAESAYGAAIRLYQDHRIMRELVSAEMALARLLLAHGRHQEARIHAEAARASAEKMGPQAVPWDIFELLRDVALAEGDEAAALRWRSRAQEVFGASPAADNVRAQWRELIRSVSDACRGAAMDMSVVEAVEKLEASPQWQHLAAAIWQVLGGERDSGAFDSLDPVDAVVVRAILDAIEKPIVDEEESESDD